MKTNGEWSGSWLIVMVAEGDGGRLMIDEVGSFSVKRRPNGLINNSKCHVICIVLSPRKELQSFQVHLNN